MRTVYVAGPMRGYEAFNFPAFDAASALGRSLGWNVLSPAEMDRAIGFDETRNDLAGFDLKAAARRDIDAIFASDAIAMLPGWEKSTGARTEHAVATWLGIQILDATTFEPLKAAA